MGVYGVGASWIAKQIQEPEGACSEGPGRPSLNVK